MASSFFCDGTEGPDVMLTKVSIGLPYPTGTTAPYVILNSIQDQLSLSKKYSRP